MAADPDSIDPNNPPAGALKQIDGRFVMGESIYDKTGKRQGALIDAMNNPQETVDTINSAASGTWIQPVLTLLPRAGVILLGTGLTIVGIMFLISGTKAASIAVDAIPVVGKVL